MSATPREPKDSAHGPDSHHSAGPKPDKVKGSVQMVAGGALIVAGVAMCVLPGPGLASVAGGAVLASKGQRNFSGRTASKVEEKLEVKAEELGSAAKREAAKTARVAAKKAPVVAGKAARAVGSGVGVVAKAGGKAAVAGAAAVSQKIRERRADNHSNSTSCPDPEA